MKILGGMIGHHHGLGRRTRTRALGVRAAAFIGVVTAIAVGACATTPDLVFTADCDGCAPGTRGTSTDAGQTDASDSVEGDAQKGTDSAAMGDSAACVPPGAPVGTACCPSGEPCIGIACSHCTDCKDCAVGFICCAQIKGNKYDRVTCEPAPTAGRCP